jgi:glucose/arabinose dehydrogenase
VKAPFLCSCLVSGILLLWSGPSAHADFPALALQPVSLQQIVSPTNISNANDGTNRLFICDQSGVIYVIQDEMVLPTLFLDIKSKLIPRAPTTYKQPFSNSYDERGLLGLAFHPNYNKKDINNQPLPGFGKFYVFYSAPSPNATITSDPNPVNCRSTISEFSVSSTNPNVADPNSERIVLAYDKPQSNHNGGQLNFGPDGYLYISIGDGGSQHDNDAGHTGGQAGNPTVSGNLGNAQDKTRLLGKVLRIDPLGNNGPGGTYGIPADNPFVGAGGGVREEIFTYGMRNPWRFSFDDGPGGTNRLFEADVGQDSVEEVNILVSGGNYGWRIMEGTFNHDSTAPNGGLPLISPIAQYAHSGVNIGSPALTQIGASVTGGYLYRGTVIPALAGKYVFGDYSPSISSAHGTLLGLEEVPPNSGNWQFSTLVVAGGNPLNTRIYAFGRDDRGEIYVATKVTRGPFDLDSFSKPTGAIYKIVPAQVSTLTLPPSQDNTIYADSTSNSNALGSLYAGNNNSSSPRRALLQFDIANQLPVGAVVATASLVLHLNNAAAAASANVSLSKLGESWGEGTSLAANGGQGTAATSGDATWLARLYDPTSPTLWTTPGGTFSATVSATTAVANTVGYYTWNSTQMALDVQAWRNTTSTNFGWILLGDETTNATVRTFDSREANAGLMPQLTIAYNPVAPPLSRRQSWLRQYYPTPGTYVDDMANSTGDGIINLMKYAFAYSPLTAYPVGSGFQSVVSQGGGNVTYTITFRRDPRAVDLTYLLQTSSDLKNWTTIVQSTAGGTPTGSGYVGETDAPGESPIRIVTGTEVLPAPANRFARLQVVRTY